MKRLLIGIVVWTFALPSVSSSVLAAVPVTKMIKVDTFYGDMAGGSVRLEPRSGAHTSAQCEWNISTTQGLKNVYRSNESYKIVTDDSGQLEVQTHIVFTWHGKTSTIDQTLPVVDQAPARADWSKLDPHLNATAYFCASDAR